MINNNTNNEPANECTNEHTRTNEQIALLFKRKKKKNTEQLFHATTGEQHQHQQ